MHAWLIYLEFAIFLASEVFSGCIEVSTTSKCVSVLADV
jgi:hypothetical protein